MTPHPAAVAALRVMCNPWTWPGIDGGPAVCVPAASEDYKRVVPAGEAQSATQRLNGRSE